ncbi:serine-rich adhesin for platelets [Diabrotica virgifera virgifera]|uniref:protein-tyrosine-phosphatase n=1 Tax=Diabrotica virgifera virgifera TaxID=50390 RepID=A0ABM5KA74_DIAVI|nr:serine-rich adhesin for platelets [Diabrotica virgifera virgifera]XP_050507089.1 serine-rich adhesin for platelets [Diabrotica virgifera virgifera]XP_050507090.1 serine-rich adhesin for platelets [Diabrotica virgifera virgifera]
MGVKLQLLLGLLLLSSTCRSESNNTATQDISSEKLDSTKNLIEKLPKTDTQTNLVRKDTQNASGDSSKYAKYPLEDDTLKNQTLLQEERNHGSDNDGKGRQDNSRAIDINKFPPADVQNNEYSGSDNQKFLDNSIRKTSTKVFSDFNFQLTTPRTKYFDTKYEEARQKLEQEYEENNPEHSDDHHMDITQEVEEDDREHDLHMDRLFGSVRNNPNSSIDYKEKTKISRNNTVDDNSEHNEIRVEKHQTLNFASEYNVTTSDEDDTGKGDSFHETTSPKAFLTTRKTMALTKPPTTHNNHILSNKIESETIKAINLLTTEDPTTKRLTDENDIVPKEQSVEENKIIPIEANYSQKTTTEHVVNVTNSREQIETSTGKLEKEPSVYRESPTTDNYDQTTVSDDINVKEATTMDDQVRLQSTTVQIPEETSTIVKDTTTDNIEETTYRMSEPTTNKGRMVTTNVDLYSTDVPVTETTTSETATKEAILPFETTSTLLPKDETTTIVLSTEVDIDTSTVVVTEATNKIEMETTTTETITDEQTTQETTTKDMESTATEHGNRVSKSFIFENTTVSESTESSVDDKLFSTTILDESKTTEKLTTGQHETLADTSTEMKTEPERTTEVSTESVHETTVFEAVTTENYVKVKSVFTVPTVQTTTTVLPEISSASTKSISTASTTSSPTPPSVLTEISSSTSSTLFSTASTTSPTTTSTTRSSTSITTGSYTPTVKFRNNSNDLGGTTVTTSPLVTSSTEDYVSDSSPAPDGESSGRDDNTGKIAAIVISTVGAVSLILLAGLLYIMRKRQKRFNYKQRCRPVSLDHYNVDNVSSFNSQRRKAERQSKRSYGNPAFDDPAGVTHPLNFPALAKFATNADDIKAEFSEIPQITAKISELPDGCETKNRYANVIPLPETRVYLQPIDGYPTSDYINANYVTGPKNTKGYYIACQGPLQNTVDDFWRMIWEQQTKVILMITHLFENGVEKCVDYLPPSEVLDCNRLFGDFQVTLKKRDVKDKYIISNLQLKNMVSNSWREVTHFWYLGWPEKGVPSEENSLIAFLIEARSYMKSSTLDKTAAANGNTNGPPKLEVNPVVVHCSPGTGRTGVVIACDIAIREFEQTRLVDIPKIVYRIRRDRASAVQTKEQYTFIYRVVSLYATKLTGGALESL